MSLPSFEFNSLLEHETWTVSYSSGQGYQDRFLQGIKTEVEKLEFPHLEMGLANYKTGGWFSSEVTPMFYIRAEKSLFKNFAGFFRAQTFGNVVVYSRMQAIEKGWFDVLMSLNGPQRYSAMRNKCKNLAQYEEFIALSTVTNLVFDSTIQKLDPEFKERKMLAARK